MAKKIAKRSFDWKIEARANYGAMPLEELESFVRYHRHETKVDGFMAHGYSLAVMSADRHEQKIEIAEDVLAERQSAAQLMVETAFAA